MSNALPALDLLSTNAYPAKTISSSTNKPLPVIHNALPARYPTHYPKYVKIVKSVLVAKTLPRIAHPVPVTTFYTIIPVVLSVQSVITLPLHLIYANNVKYNA